MRIIKEKKPKSKIGRKFATIDCETDPFLFGRVPKPFIWGYYDENGFQHFFDTKDFIDFLRQQDRLIYAHNGGKFDFHFLFEGLEPQERVMIINGRIASFKIGNAELRDSYLLLPVPLSAYKKDEIDYAIFEENVRMDMKNISSIITYLKGDCQYLYDILTVQFELYGQKLTLASSAFDFWHKKFNPYKNKPSTSESFFASFKPYYYGGRVQCFTKGIINHPFKVYDINSAYPYAMQFDHPFGDEYTISHEITDINKIDFISFWGTSKGALPFRDIDKSLSFPNDNELRLYNVTGWEFRKGIEHGLIGVKKIESVIYFENRISFKDYVDHFFKEKADNKDIDDAKYLLAKLYMNSLYGKFAQSPLDHREYELIEPAFIESYIGQGYEYEGLFGDWALMSTPIDENRMKFYNVATAASITGFVRAFLFEHILKADTPLYCDTDSIAAIDLNCSQGDLIGQWSFEGDFVRGAIGGKKLYAFERKIPKKELKFKLSSKGAKLSEKDIFSIANGETIEYKNNAPTFSVGKEPSFVVRNIKMT